MVRQILLYEATLVERLKDVLVNGHISTEIYHFLLNFDYIHTCNEHAMVENF